ncbi:MAG: acyl-CoA dehydrogenase family protein [Pseudomonadota bacterium]
MYFHFTDDQREFGEAMCSFFMKEATPELARELWDTPTGRSSEMWARVAEQGMLGMSVPENFGGLGCGDDAWSLMTQVIGYYGGSDGLFETAWLAAALIDALGPDSPERARWLPRIAAGEVRLAIGHPVNPLVADAHVADLLLLAHGHEVHAVHREDVRMSPRRSIDASRRLFHVEWTPSRASCIADAELGQRLWADTLNRGALAVAGQMNGLTQRLIDLSVDYTAQRKQFGKPVGSFQAVKHLIANVAVELEFAKPVTYRAAYAQAEREDLRDVHVSHAKLVAADAARLACRNGIQVHGAMGYTWDMDLQIFAKRVWALDATWGDEAFHKARVAQHVFDPAAALGPGHTFSESTE